MVREHRQKKEKPSEAKPVEAKAVKPASTKRKAAEDSSPIQKKKQKPVKSDATTEPRPTAKKAAANGASKPTQVKEGKGAKKAAAGKAASKKAKADVEQEPEVPEEELSEDEVGDETQALVQTLDDGADEDDEIEGGEVFKKGQDVGKIPKIKGADKAKKADEAGNKGETGVIYIGRLPHGFYEHEMRGYFSQFGEILKLRLSRSKKTGASKHYAFIEFRERSTAEIVAKTMDSYLLFRHVLRVRVVNEIPEGLFKGANRRFKKVPWNKMAGRELEQPRTESAWADKIDKENKKRVTRASKLEDIMGYEYEASQVKDLEKAAKQDDAPKEIEAPAVGDAEVEVEKTKKVKAKAPKGKANKAKIAA